MSLDFTPPSRAWEGTALPARATARQRIITTLLAWVAVIATLGYLTWRVLFTMSGVSLLLAIPLLIVEVHAFISALGYGMLLWDVDSQLPAPRVTATDQRVVILVPTYNEPAEVLLPTILGASQVRLASDVLVLDDGRREWVAQECATAGVSYRTRSGNAHAKAGNVNAALDGLEADVVLILDADHVPAPDFIEKTLGYFEDPRVAIVQTPQDFYNQDSFEHSVLGGRLFSEQELFYRALQAGRNRWNAAFWCGTGAMLRVSALRELGGVATDSITEDILTTIRLHRRGWRTVHHNEVLARGLAATGSDQYLSQRLRWGTGAMQTLRAERFMCGPGLSFAQRIGYLSTTLGWFDSWRMLAILLLPVLTIALAASPIDAPLVAFLLIFLPVFLVQRIAMSRLARGHAHVWQSTVFDIIKLPATLRATLAIATNRERPFHVTHKGRAGHERTRGSVPALLWILLGVMLTALLIGFAWITGLLARNFPSPWVGYLSMLWLVINIALLITAIRRIRSARFASERRSSARIEVSGGVLLDGHPVQVLDLSMGGARLRVLDRDDLTLGEKAHVLTFPNAVDVPLSAEVIRCIPHGSWTEVHVRFTPGQEHAAAALTVPLLS